MQSHEKLIEEIIAASNLGPLPPEEPLTPERHLFLLRNLRKEQLFDSSRFSLIHASVDQNPALIQSLYPNAPAEDVIQTLQNTLLIQMAQRLQPNHSTTVLDIEKFTFGFANGLNTWGAWQASDATQRIMADRFPLLTTSFVFASPSTRLRKLPDQINLLSAGLVRGYSSIRAEYRNGSQPDPYERIGGIFWVAPGDSKITDDLPPVIQL